MDAEYNGVDLYAHKTTSQSHMSESSSAMSVASSARVFGIARRPSASSSAHQILSGFDLSQPAVPETVEKFNGSANHATAAPPSSYQRHTDSTSTTGVSRTADVARWMGKPSNSDANQFQNSSHSSKNGGSLIKPPTENNCSRSSQQPFQGLFEQLKRSSSLDLSSSEPPAKR